PAIERILRDLGGHVPVPILVAQHMPAGFTRPFAERLNIQLPLEVREPVHGEPLVPGTVYIAPGGLHLRLESGREGLRAAVGGEPASAPHRPSVDVLFASAAEAGARTVAVLLTGMGQDGADGMLRLTECGAFTIAQDEATSVIFGMPRAAAAVGGAREILPLPEI